MDLKGFYLLRAFSLKRNPLFKRPIGTGSVNKEKACRAVCYGCFLVYPDGTIAAIATQFFS
jgi:hypothetical protein